MRYMTLAVCALAASTISPALSAPIQQVHGQSLSERGLFGSIGDMVKGLFHKPKAPEPRPPAPAAPAPVAATEPRPPPPAEPAAPKPAAVPEPPVKPEGPSEPPVPEPVPTKSWKGKAMGYAGDLGLVTMGTVAGGELLENLKKPGNSTGNSTDSTGLASSTDPTGSTGLTNSADYSTPGTTTPGTNYYSPSGNPNNPTTYYSTSGSSTNPNNPTYSSSTSSTNPYQNVQYNGNPNYAYSGLQQRSLLSGEEALSLFGRMLDELD